MKALKKVSLRLLFAGIFSFIWYIFFGEGLTAAPPLVFSAFLFFLAAWFGYLRSDGFRFINIYAMISNVRMKLMAKRLENPSDTNKFSSDSTSVSQLTQQKDSSPLDFNSIKINLISGALLILLSFVFSI